MTTDVEKLIEPYVDVGTLLLIDRDPIEGLPNDVSAEQLNELTRKNVQYLFNKIWTLPRKVVQDATCVQLPAPQYALPREKPIPKPKEPTKWEKFAKTKGIVKKKTSKKAWDETAQDWKPTYGYRRANDENKDWLIEIPDQADPYKDYFAERAEAKRDRVNKQELQRLKNIARANKASSDSSSQPIAGQNSAKSPIFNGKGQETTMKANNNIKTFPDKPLGLEPIATKSKEQLVHQLDRAKKATASMGKFQPALKGEKRARGTGIRRKFEPNEGDATEERKRQLEILAKLQAKKPKMAVAESRLNSVNEHIKREEKRDMKTDESGHSDSKNRKSGKGGRSKSKIDRQQRFQSVKKQIRKSGFKSARSKAGRAVGKRGGASGGKGRK